MSSEVCVRSTVSCESLAKARRENRGVCNCLRMMNLDTGGGERNRERLVFSGRPHHLHALVAR